MIDWTSILVGVGTSLIATGITGVCKSIVQRIRQRRTQSQLKKPSNVNKIAKINGLLSFFHFKKEQFRRRNAENAFLKILTQHSLDLTGHS